MPELMPVDYVKYRGKLWLFLQSSMVLQCAYCIKVQGLHPVRDDTGLVTGLTLNNEEDHQPNCPQLIKEESPDAGTTS